MYSKPIRFCPLFVLAVGLVSCNQKSLSSLNIPEPVWETDGSQRSYNLTDSLMRELKITDRLSLADSPASSLKAGVRCVQGTKNSIQSSRFVLPAKIPLYSFLPIELLRPGALDTSTTCSLFFVAQDATGSSHTFTIKDFLVRPSNKASGIEPMDDSSLVKDSDFKKYEFRLADNQSIPMQLICEDFSIATEHPDHRNLQLSEFRFPPEFTKGRTHQQCRLLGFRNGNVALISKTMTFRFGNEAPVFESHTLSTSGRLPIGEFPVFSFKIKNPTLDHLRLRISKSNASKLVMLVPLHPGETNADCAAPPVKIYRMINFRISVPASKEFKETEHDYQFDLPSGKAVEGMISAQAPFATVGEFQIRVPDAMEVSTFYGEDWQFSGSIPWTIHSKSLWSAQPSQFPPGPCGQTLTSSAK